MSDLHEKYREKLKGDYSVSHRITEQANCVNTYHVHDELEIIFIKRGTAYVTVNEEKFEVRDGSILLFNQTDLHGIVPYSEIFDRYVLYFKPEFLDTLSSESTRLLECFYLKNTTSPNHIALTPENAAAFSSLFEQIWQCSREQNDLDGKDLEQKYLVALALVRINRLYAENSLLPVSKRRKNYQIIYNSMLYIQNNITGDLSLTTLAAINYIDKNRLCSVFSETLGMSPIQYVLKMRISKAKQLLINDYHIEEVSAQCGFNSLSHFSRTFKAQVGISPKQFSKQGKTNESC